MSGTTTPRDQLMNRLQNLQQEWGQVKDILKSAFMAAPMDPSMMGGMPPGQPPMYPSMMGGMPPGQPPMYPSMMGGMPPGQPPMDPSMMGGQPSMDPNAGAPPQGLDPGLVEEIVGALESLGQQMEAFTTQQSEVNKQVSGELQQMEERLADFEKMLISMDAENRAVQKNQPQFG